MALQPTTEAELHAVQQWLRRLLDGVNNANSAAEGVAVSVYRNQIALEGQAALDRARVAFEEAPRLLPTLYAETVHAGATALYRDAGRRDFQQTEFRTLCEGEVLKDSFGRAVWRVTYGSVAQAKVAA